MAIDVFCSLEQNDWVIKSCGQDKAGIIAMMFIDLSENPTNANLGDRSFILARLAASPQHYFLVQPTRGEYPGGTPTEEDGFGKDVIQVTGADHTATVEAPGLKENRDFWEAINRKKWKVVFYTNSDYQYYESNPVTVYAKIMNPKSIKASAFWSVLLKWQHMDNPIILDTPANLLTAV